jgi:phosphoglycerate dehydrogenase-like enzyme
MKKARVLVAADHRFSPLMTVAELLPEFEVAVEGSAGLLRKVQDADILISTVVPIDRKLIYAGNFGLIQQFGVGIDPIDVQAATEAGVLVARVPAKGCGNATAVAEHALMLMLALARRLPEAMERIQQGVLTQPLGMMLHGKTAVIVGLGDLGTAISILLKAFGMKVLATRANPEKGLPHGACVDRLGGNDELETMLGEADFVILSLSYSPQTRHFFDAQKIAATKPGAFLINVARGGVLETEALTAALASGQIAGAGLDVFDPEPVDPSLPLFRYNVIATPHTAGFTDVSVRGICRLLADNIRRYQAGEMPLHTVNNPLSIRRKAS